MIVVNFKIYEETFGDGGLRMAKICKEVSQRTGVKIIPSVSALDAYRITNELGIEVWLQNVDEVFEGAKSGSVSPLQAKKMGILGTLINHSENRKKPGTIKKMLKNWPDNFKSMLCLSSFGQVEGWAKNVKPDFIAYEPKELIGSKEKSVASEKPEVIKKIVDKYPKVSVFVGAGIHTKKDVEVSLQLGAKGILISSYVIKNKKPEIRLEELAKCFKAG